MTTPADAERAMAGMEQLGITGRPRDGGAFVGAKNFAAVADNSFVDAADRAFVARFGSNASAAAQDAWKSAPIRNVGIAKLQAIQEVVKRETVADFFRDPGRLKAQAASSAPNVLRYQGQLLIWDGHHRIAALKLSGEKTARVRIIDLDKAK